MEKREGGNFFSFNTIDTIITVHSCTIILIRLYVCVTLPTRSRVVFRREGSDCWPQQHITCAPNLCCIACMQLQQYITAKEESVSITSRRNRQRQACLIVRVCCTSEQGGTRRKMILCTTCTSKPIDVVFGFKATSCSPEAVPTMPADTMAARENTRRMVFGGAGLAS